MLKHHDLTKLEACGFDLREHVVGGQLDGVSATLRLDGSIYLKIYQGCHGVYKLQGQGRGRPKQRVLVDQEWFEPSWYIQQRASDEWTNIADGVAVNVDRAVDDSLRYFRRLFPTVALPPSVA